LLDFSNFGISGRTTNKSLQGANGIFEVGNFLCFGSLTDGTLFRAKGNE